VLKDIYMVLIAGFMALLLYLAVQVFYVFAKFMIVALFLLFCYWYFRKSNYERSILWQQLTQLFSTVRMMFFRK